MHRTGKRHDSSKAKKRKVIKDEMLCEDESNNEHSNDESLISAKLRQQLLKYRKPMWDAFFEKYELKSKEDSLEDCLSVASESGRWKEWELRSKRTAMKVKNWHEDFNSASISSKDQNEQPVEEEATDKNVGIGTVENTVVGEHPVRNLSSRFSVPSDVDKMDKIKKVKKDISQNIYQLRSRKNGGKNFEKERNDVSQGSLSKGINKKYQKNTSESRTFQYANNFDQIHQQENSRINDLCKESDTEENTSIDEHLTRKSRSRFRRASNNSKKGKIKVVKKDINQNVYQLRLRKHREGNFEKEKNDNTKVSDSCNERNNTVENPVVNERSTRKSKSKFNKAASIGKIDEIDEKDASVKKDNNQNVYQLHFKKQKEGNCEKERNDESQKRSDETSRAKDSCNDSDNTIEKPNVDERLAQNSKSRFSESSSNSKKDKIKSVKNDINQNINQIHSGNKREDNFGKEKEVDEFRGFNLIGVIKTHQERNCESRTFQNANNFERLPPCENSIVSNTVNESDDKPCVDVCLEELEQVKEGLRNKTILSQHIPEEMKKKYSNGDVNFLNVKNKANISENLSRIKLGLPLKVNKQKWIVNNETNENTAALSPLSVLNFSIDSMYTDSEDFSLAPEKTFEKLEPKNIQKSNSVSFPKETERREILEWGTEFSNFIKYQWNDFKKNPGSMLFPLPKLKPFRQGEKLSWESIMNDN